MKKKSKHFELVTRTASIKKISFIPRFLIVHLLDGRIIQFKLSLYPMIRKLNSIERKKLTIITLDEGHRYNLFTFDACNDMFFLDDKLNLIVD